jgi:hypothetical protein
LYVGLDKEYRTPLSRKTMNENPKINEVGFAYY